MTLKDLAGHSGFWNAIRYFENIESHGVDINSACHDLNCNLRDVYSILGLMKDLGSRIDIQDSRVYNSKEVSVLRDLQGTVLYVSNIESEFAQNFQEYTKSVLSSDIFEAVNQFVEKMSDEFADEKANVLSFKRTEETSLIIERAIFHKYALKVLCKDQREMRILPYKLMKLDGHLTLIGENLVVGEGVHISLHSISYIEEKTQTYQPMLTKLELDDHISSLRSIKETEVRLILKVDAGINWEERLPYQHFGNPCMIKKGKGHVIWAASVEPSEEIFEWISNMGSGVEIIDPCAFKRIYLRYCEDRLLKLG